MSIMDVKKIDTETLGRMITGRIQELELKGLVDYHFRQCHSLKEDDGPSFFLNLVVEFLNNVRTEVKDMAETLNQPVVDFNKMFSHFIKLKGSSSCIGACRIKDACSALNEAIKNKSVERGFSVLDDIQREYNILHIHLEDIRKIESEIVSRSTDVNQTESYAGL